MLTMSPRLCPVSALPIGRLVRELLLRGVGLGRPDDRELSRFAGFLVLDVYAYADPDHAGVDRLLVDDARPPQPFLELGDPLLEQGLLVLGVVVLGVLGDVAELARLLDPLGDLAALDRREMLDLRPQLLEPFLV